VLAYPLNFVSHSRGSLQIPAPVKEIFKPNVTVTGTCKKCGKKSIYVESDVIQMGQMTITEGVSVRIK
jgi:hypothetical protein